MVERALDLWNRHAPAHPDKVTALITAGRVTYTLGDIPGAHRRWTEAVALARRAAGRGPSVVGPRRDWTGPQRACTRRLCGSAAPEGRRRSHRTEKSLSACDPDVADQLNDLSNSLVYFRDLVSAQRMLRRKLSIVESCHASADSVATTLINLFHIAKDMGAMREAETLRISRGSRLVGRVRTCPSARGVRPGRRRDVRGTAQELSARPVALRAGAADPTTSVRAHAPHRRRDADQFREHAGGERPR